MAINTDCSNGNGPRPRMTFGCELEWSDIDRRIDIPAELGSWEGPKMAGYHMGSEIDIVNTQGKWKCVAADPLCITCPVGGEIHTVPSPTIESQMFRIMRIMELFPKLGVACPNHGHIHVGVEGLKTDLTLLKNFFVYLEKNEEDLIKYCCGYGEKDHDTILDSKLPDWAKAYFLVGDGKHISADLYRAIKDASSIEDAMLWIANTPCVDWYPVTGETIETPESHRTAVNMFNLTKGNTIEFRIFRASLNPIEIFSTLKFAERFCEEAVKGDSGMPVKEILLKNVYQFPKLNFDLELAEGWVATRQTKGRCGPFKKSFSSATNITLDSIESEGPLDGFDGGLVNILEICYVFWSGKNIDDLREEYYNRPTAASS